MVNWIVTAMIDGIDYMNLGRFTDKEKALERALSHMSDANNDTDFNTYGDLVQVQAVIGVQDNVKAWYDVDRNLRIDKLFDFTHEV